MLTGVEYYAGCADDGSIILLRWLVRRKEYGSGFFRLDMMAAWVDVLGDGGDSLQV